jgi:hypothetical protein
MDVVMVKDFGPLLNLASTATTLEQNRKAAETKLAHGRKAGAALGMPAVLSAAGCNAAKQCRLPHGLVIVRCGPKLFAWSPEVASRALSMCVGVCCSCAPAQYKEDGEEDGCLHA